MKQKERAFSIIFIILVIVLVVFRLVRSIELTDESYYIAEIYNAALGHKPFVDLWDPHTGWFLYAPIFMLFHLFSPDLEGVVIFFRFIYLILAIACLTVSWLLIRKKNENQAIICTAVFACISFVCFSIPQMGYNAAVAYILILVFSLLCGGAHIPRWIKYTCIGILMGIACLLYPTMAVTMLLLPVPVCLFAGKGKRIRSLGFYFIGVMLVGILFFIWIYVGNGFQRILDGIRATISTPHEANKGPINLEFLRLTFVYPFQSIFNGVRISIASLYVMGMIVISRIKKINYKKRLLIDLIMYLLLIIASFVSVLIDAEIPDYAYPGFISFVIFIGTIVFHIMNRSLISSSYVLLYILIIAWVLTFSFTSDNRNLLTSFNAAGTMVVFAGSLIPVIACCGVNQLKKTACIKFLVPCFLALVGICCFYGYVYRDGAIPELNYRVETGIYKGLYTSEEKGKYIMELEQELSSCIGTEETVFVVNNMPGIYLMSHAKICTPETWDAQYLYKGYSSAEPVLTFFTFINKYPDIIVASDYLHPDIFERDDIQMWMYINDNYYLRSVIEQGESVTKIWEKGSDDEKES